MLWPTHDLRSSPIETGVLTGGEVDTIAGLLTLRERHAFGLYATATAPVHAVLDSSPIFQVLARDVVTRRTVALDEPVAIGEMSVTLFAVPGKVPLYLEQDDQPVTDLDDQTVGAAVSDGKSTLFFIPGCAVMIPALRKRLRDSETVLFDARLWRDDKMITSGLGPKTGAGMRHMSVSGPTGILAAFEGLGVQRRILIHINNSNPVLLDDSPERAEAAAAGWEVAYDGMELSL